LVDDSFFGLMAVLSIEEEDEEEEGTYNVVSLVR